MSQYDPSEISEYLNNICADAGMLAAADQRHAALGANRETGMWWSALSMLATDRGNEVANAIAVQNLKHFMHTLDQDDLIILASYLLHNTIQLVAMAENGGDVPAAVFGIVGPQQMMLFEKFVATSGKTCLHCGMDDGWSDHDCKPITDEDDDDEPVEG